MFWLRSRVIDSCAALERAVPRPAVTAALAALASTHGVFGLLTHGWSNRPSWNFSVRIRPHRLVDPRHLDRARVHVLEDGRLPLIGADYVHSHVDAGVHGLGDRLSRIGGNVVEPSAAPARPGSR